MGRSANAALPTRSVLCLLEMQSLRGGGSLRAELRHVFVKLLCRVEFGEQIGNRDFQRLAQIQEAEVTDPDELAFDFGNPGLVDFPTENLQSRREVRLQEAKAVTPFANLRPDNVFVFCAHMGASKAGGYFQKLPFGSQVKMPIKSRQDQAR